MDGVRRYIADSSNRNEDHIEKADAALGAVAVNCLLNRDAEFVVVVTTDTDAGKELSRPSMQMDLKTAPGSKLDSN